MLLGCWEPLASNSFTALRALCPSKDSELHHTGVLGKRRMEMLHSRAAPASRVTREENFAGAAFNTESGAGFSLPFGLVLWNPISLDHLYFTLLTCIRWQCARTEKCLLALCYKYRLKKRVHIRSTAIPCFMEHFIAFPSGNRLMLLCLLAWSIFTIGLLRALFLGGSFVWGKVFPLDSQSILRSLC